MNAYVVTRVTAGGYELDDDPARVDAGVAARFLTTQAYWGRWRSAEVIRQQIGTA